MDYFERLSIAYRSEAEQAVTALNEERLEYRAIAKICDQHDEFGRCYDPEVALPPLAERVYGIVYEQWEQNQALQARITELEAEQT